MKNKLRQLSFPLSLILMTYFLTMIGLHYGNIGSRTGLILSLLLLYWSVQKDHEEGRMPAILKNVFRTLAVIILSLAVLTTGFMIHGGNAYDGTDRTVIILGCGVNDDGKPTPMMQTRIDEALPYIQEHPDSAVIVTGGIQRSDLPSEAYSMKEYLVEHDVKTERIHMDEQAASTYENLKNAAEIIDEDHLSRNVLISTNEFHQYRAALFAERDGLSPVSLNAKTPWYLLPVCWIYEMYGILSAWIFGN